jgi:prepilin-type N-terminal cleavage/methylation domain-containing protein
MRRSRSSYVQAFTIVELLVVIVVIGILATITIIAYKGISQRAITSSIQSDLSGDYNQLANDNTINGVYPATAAAANNGQGLKASPGNVIQYTYTSGSNSYCLSVTNGLIAYYVTSSSNQFVSGVCAGQTAPGGPTGQLAFTKQTNAGTGSWGAVASSSDGTKLVATKWFGYIYTSTDSGVTWTARSSPGTHEWVAVTSSADGTKLAAATLDAGPGNIYTSTDSGVTWTLRSAPGTLYWGALGSSADGNKLIAGAANDYVYTSTDAGATWTQHQDVGSGNSDGPGFGNWGSVALSADGTKAIISNSGQGFICLTTNSGATWTENSTFIPDGGGIGTVASSSDGTKLAASNGGYIYTSTDSGATWTQRTSSGVRQSWGQIASSADGTHLIVAGTDDGSIYKLYTSTDSGATWTLQAFPTGVTTFSNYLAISSDGTKVLIGAATGSLYTATW